MIMLQWNALRVGDRVLVHDDRDPNMSLVAGVVAIVQSVHGSNDLGICISDDGARNTIVRPRRLAVHLQPLDADEMCWRCAIATATHHNGYPSRKPGAGVEPATT